MECYINWKYYEKAMRESVHGLMEGPKEKHEKIMVGNVPAEIQSEHLSNTSLEHIACTILFIVAPVIKFNGPTLLLIVFIEIICAVCMY
jgi:hypothetical protein